MGAPEGVGMGQTKHPSIPTEHPVPDAVPVVGAERFELGSLTFVVFELGPAVPLPRELTPAEGAIVQALFQGKSTGQIAEERCVSYRTVAKQLASIYRKLRVNSAVELMALLQRP